MQIAPGVHRVPGILGNSNVYLIAEEELALVDTGVPFNGRRVARYIQRIGRSRHELKHILVTHGHIDHMGSVLEVKALTGARILAHRGDTRLHRDGEFYLTHPGIQSLFPGTRRGPIDDFLEEGDTLPYLGGLRVIHTPGHTPGSLCFYAPQKGVLFTGDTLISRGLRFARPFLWPGSDPDRYRESLKKLLALDFEVACCGHGRPALHGASRGLRESLDHLQVYRPWWRVLREGGRWERGFPSLSAGLRLLKRARLAFQAKQGHQL